MNIPKDKLIVPNNPAAPRFIIEQLVEFPVYVFNISDMIDNQEIVSKTTCDFKNSNRKDIIINGYQSDYFFTKENDTFANLIQIVEDKANSLHDIKYFVDHFWYVIYKKGSSQRMHKHVAYNIFLAGAYYPEIYPTSSPLLFLNGRASTIKYQPKQGDLVLFDNRLQHCVPDNSDDKPRIVFSFNFKIKI